MYTKTHLRSISLGLALVLVAAPALGCSNKNSASSQDATSAAATSQEKEKKQVDVPNVVGMTSEEAHAALWALNLEDEIMSSSVSGTTLPMRIPIATCLRSRQGHLSP